MRLFPHNQGFVIDGQSAKHVYTIHKINKKRVHPHNNGFLIEHVNKPLKELQFNDPNGYSVYSMMGVCVYSQHRDEYLEELEALEEAGILPKRQEPEPVSSLRSIRDTTDRLIDTIMFNNSCKNECQDWLHMSNLKSEFNQADWDKYVTEQQSLLREKLQTLLGTDFIPPKPESIVEPVQIPKSNYNKLMNFFSSVTKLVYHKVRNGIKSVVNKIKK